jgi:hypothetical protein
MYWQQLDSSGRWSPALTTSPATSTTRHVSRERRQVSSLRAEETRNIKHAVDDANMRYCCIASMTVTQYLGTGSTSRGRLGISTSLSINIATQPYLRTSADRDTAIKSLQNINDTFAGAPNLTWIEPAPGQSASTFFAGVSTSTEKGHSFCSIMLTEYETDPPHLCKAKLQPLDR